MIKRRDLVRALGDHGLADWVLVERDQQLACVDDAAKLRRVEKRLLWQLTVHHDAPTGRGSSHVTLDAAEGDADAAVRQAVTLARAAIGPAWVSRPAGAPARVRVEDPATFKRDPLDVATSIARSVAAPAGTTVAATGKFMREHVTVVARQGLRTDWTATHVRGELAIAASGRSLRVEREARTTADLQLGAALAAATEDLGLLAKAGAPKPGPCVLVLRPDALLHGGVGVWGAFASQADAIVERQGLTRYRERTPIAPGADQAAEPLTITSNGAIDFGLRSEPLGPEGDAVRRFTLVERGIAVGLGLSPREGSLRGRDPNGGVRNLVVELGKWNGSVGPDAGRVIEVRRLHALSIDPYTGEAALEVALGLDADGTPFTGGSLRIDLIAALAVARRSAKQLQRGAYVGPDAIMIPRAELLG